MSAVDPGPAPAPLRRPVRVERTAEGYVIHAPEPVPNRTLGPLTEDELRWLGLTLIPAALPPLPVPGIERAPTRPDS